MHGDGAGAQFCTGAWTDQRIVIPIDFERRARNSRVVAIERHMVRFYLNRIVWLRLVDDAEGWALLDVDGNGALLDIDMGQE